MAISEAFAGTQDVDGTEWSMPRDASFDSAQPQTADGVYQAFIDLSTMATGDEYQIRIYEKAQAGDTQRVVYQSNLVGPQSPPMWVSPSLVLINGFDFTLKRIAGATARTITWSIRSIA